MSEEPRVMREIHAIQERIHEEENGLTGQERLNRLHREAELAKKKFGFQFRKAVFPPIG